jgi:hypothetical protein
VDGHIAGRIALIPMAIFSTGCQTTQKELPKSDFQFYLESKENSKDEIWSASATMPISALKINIYAYPILLAGDVELAHISESNFGKCISFKLTQRATVEFYKLSVECVGQKIIFIFNGKALGLSMPIANVIRDGTFIIFPEVEEEDLEALLRDINDTVMKLKKLQ